MKTCISLQESDACVHHIYKAIISCEPKTDWLSNGNLGKGLFLMNYSQVFNSENAYYKSLDIFKKVTSAIGVSKKSIQKSSSIAHGLSGLGVVFFLLKEKGIVNEASGVDALHHKMACTIKERVLEEISLSDLDPLHSSIGGFFYLLLLYGEGLFSAKDIQPVLEALLGKVEYIQGVARIKNLRGSIDSSYTNLGLAHGMTGILLVLLEAYKFNLCRDRLEQCIEKLIGFVLFTENSKPHSTEEYLFLREVHDDESIPYTFSVSDYSAMGWCYSDLSIAFMLLKAQYLLKIDYYKSKAIKIINNTVQRVSYVHHQVDSSIFCHGASGIAHLLNKCYDFTNEQAHLQAVGFWESEIKRFFEGEQGKFMNSAYNLLQGWNGAGLVLMTLKNKKGINWDKVFLL